jgi:exodeoxyribonuclease VII large subunit
MQDDLPPPHSAQVDGDNNPVFTLKELSQALKKTVESTYDHVRVRAEISRPVHAGSGHVYFTLKDDQATLDAVCWKTVVGSLQVRPEDGLEVVATGKLTIYPGRSKYQIVIKTLELAGEGALLKQLEERKQRLYAEGLFDDDRKKQIPVIPMTIGVVTSPDGAVIRDILHRLKERFPVQVLVWPVLVQGEGAAADITAAISGFDALLDHPDPPVPVPDVVIVARGGGSLEDLMAFNDEAVVRAVAASRLPLISAIGHETDHTLIDFAADLRAPTPTAAAELATPVKTQLDARLADLVGRLTHHLSRQTERSGQQLRDLGRALGDPEMLLSTKTQQLDLQFSALDRFHDLYMHYAVERLRQWMHRLRTPEQQLVEGEKHLALLDLDNKLDAVVASSLARLERASLLLKASSFQDILDRGFALVTGPDGKLMRSARSYVEGGSVKMTFSDGSRQATLGRDGAGHSGSALRSAQSKKTGKKAGKKAGKKSGDPGQDDLF